MLLSPGEIALYQSIIIIIITAHTPSIDLSMGFFKVLIKTSKPISIDTAANSTLKLKLANLPNLPPTKQTSINSATLQSYLLVSFQQITFKLGNFTWFLVFPAVLTDFCHLFPVKSRKKSWKGLLSIRTTTYLRI